MPASGRHGPRVARLHGTHPGSKPGYLGEASDFGEQTVGAGCRGVRELGRQIVTSSFSRGSMCHVESGEERLKPNQTGLSFECLSQ